MADNTVKLNELVISSRRLRFLHLKSAEEVILNSSLYGKHLPLFLGADVLSSCPISVPNLPRTHAKYAKKGFATKINFPSSYRINGIQGTGNGVWFYSIQGFYRVAFELYSRAEQLEVLQCLQALWTSRFTDPALLTTISPTRLEFSKENKESVNTTGNTLTVRPSRCILSKDNEFLDTAVCPPSEIGSQTTGNGLENRSKATSACQTDAHHKGYQAKWMELFSDLQDLINTNEENSRLNEDVIISTLQTILNCYKTIPEMADILSELDNEETILYIVCYWVGKEFRKYKEEILHCVTDFKKRHIATIDNLPSSETVIKELFPQCMIILLRTWMELETPSQESQIWLPFPLMQLILEFANQTLVSGVSHVLYSRLIRSDCV